MKLLLIVSLILLMGCDSVIDPEIDSEIDNKIPFDEPSWVGNWTGEMYNDLDLDHINGPRGRIDSLDVSFFWDGAEGFDVSGAWKTIRPGADDLGNDVHGHATVWGEEGDSEWMNFLAIVGDGVEALDGYKFACWTNGTETDSVVNYIYSFFSELEVKIHKGAWQKIFEASYYDGPKGEALTCVRVRSALDSAFPGIVPAPFEIFYLFADNPEIVV